MNHLTVVPDVDAAGGMPGLRGREATEPSIVHLGNGANIEVGGLAAGTESGKPSVALVFHLPGDGDPIVVAETTLALFLSAADALKARHGDPRLEQ